MKLNIAEQPQQPTRLKVQRSQSSPEFTGQHAHSNKTWASVAFKIFRLFVIALEAPQAEDKFAEKFTGQ